MSRCGLVAIRHAKPSLEGVCYGRIDVPTELSAEDASRRIALTSSLDRVDLVWSSPSPRCRDLATTLAAARSLPHRVDERLLELSFGRWEGRAWTEIHAAEPEALARWGERWREEAPPGGETCEALEARVEEWRGGLDRGIHHLLIGHAGVIRALSVLAGERDWEEAMATPIPHLEPHFFLLE